MSIDSLVHGTGNQRAVLRRLAEPNLMALSGDSARFLAGGEFPVPVASTAGRGRLSHRHHRIQEVRRRVGLRAHRSVARRDQPSG